MRVYDLAQLGRSPLGVGRSDTSGSGVVPRHSDGFFVRGTDSEGTDVPEIVAIIEYPDAGEVRIFSFVAIVIHII